MGHISSVVIYPVELGPYCLRVITVIIVSRNLEIVCTVHFAFVG
jgi:hypothetical protein